MQQLRLAKRLTTILFAQNQGLLKRRKLTRGATLKKIIAPIGWIDWRTRTVTTVTIHNQRVSSARSKRISEGRSGPNLQVL